MKRKFFALALAGICLMAQGCQPKGNHEATDTIPMTGIRPAKLKTCHVAMDGITFTHALNGADTCIVQKNDTAITLRCAEKHDFFCDPNDGKLTQTNLPMLLAQIDNSRPFTLIAKVTPGFTTEGQYNAADLFVYANDTLWQKFAFEQDERGRHRIVTVRTQGTSDDNNHERITDSSIYLKLSSDTHTLACYYSSDQKEWQMARLYENNYPSTLWVGIASQCPQKGECISVFEDISISQTAVSDFRLGN